MLGIHSTNTTKHTSRQLLHYSTYFNLVRDDVTVPSTDGENIRLSSNPIYYSILGHHPHSVRRRIDFEEHLSKPFYFWIRRFWIASEIARSDRPRLLFVGLLQGAGLREQATDPPGPQEQHSPRNRQPNVGNLDERDVKCHK